MKSEPRKRSWRDRVVKRLVNLLNGLSTLLVYNISGIAWLEHSARDERVFGLMINHLFDLL